MVSPAVHTAEVRHEPTPTPPWTRRGTRRPVNGPPRLIDRSLRAELAAARARPRASKADRGKLLIVAGSVGLPGAALLAARAALRVGCGTVRVAAPRSVAVALGVARARADGRAPARDRRRHGRRGRAGACSKPSSARATPSWSAPASGRTRRPTGSPRGSRPLARCRRSSTPAPCSPGAGPATRRPSGPRVLTPHPGEMAELIGLEPDRIEADREAVATRFAAEWGAVLVLKGPRTLVAGRGALRQHGRDARPGDGRQRRRAGRRHRRPARPGRRPDRRRRLGRPPPRPRRRGRRRDRSATTA